MRTSDKELAKKITDTETQEQCKLRRAYGLCVKIGGDQYASCYDCLGDFYHKTLNKIAPPEPELYYDPNVCPF